MPEVSGVDPEVVVPKAEGVFVRIANAGSGIHSHTSLSNIGIHHTGIRVRSDLTGKIQRSAAKLLYPDAQIEHDRDDLLSIEPRPETDLVDRSLLTIEFQAVRLVITKKLIIDIIERVRGIYGRHSILYLFTADIGAGFQVYLVLKIGALLVANPDYLDSGNHDLPEPDVIGDLILQRLDILTDNPLDGIQGGGLSYRRFIAPVDDNVDTL